MYIRQSARTHCAWAQTDPANTSDGRGRIQNIGLHSLERQSLPTDPIGTCTLPLANVVAGSRVHIESQDGSTVHYDAIAAGTGLVTVTPVINVYSAGSAKNDWRIRVRNASGTPAYKPYETLTTATAGTKTPIYISQQED